MRRLRVDGNGRCDGFEHALSAVLNLAQDSLAGHQDGKLLASQPRHGVDRLGT